MAGASKPVDVSTKRQRIAQLARQSPEMGFTSLAYLIDLDWLTEAFDRTRKDGAVGVDGQDGEAYAADLMGNLQSLRDRAKSGTYQAPPVRRVHIPKAGSATETRPLGIPTFEDKVLQRSVVMVLEAVYEQDFLDCSYGFRPGRSAHQALDSLWRQTMAMGGGWIVDVDIRKFFETIDHGHLRAFLQRRVRDGVLLRLIGKWLNAGVLEDGCVTHPEKGSPQGGVVSPMLSNVFLHYVLDEWFEREVQPRLKGRSFLIRYADDFVMGFSCEEDARRVMDVLPKRFEKYGLTIPPEKTRLVPLRAALRRPGRSELGGADSSRDLRPAGLHALLGRLTERELGGEAQDVQEPLPPRIESPVGMVSKEPPPADRGSAPDPESEACGPLRVLRDHRQLHGAGPIPYRSHLDLEALAVASSSAWQSDDLGPPQSLPEASPASARDRGPLGVPSRSEYVT
jgi:group II intron reverse transcriptase/maturase